MKLSANALIEMAGKELRDAQAANAKQASIHRMQAEALRYAATRLNEAVANARS